MDFELSEDQKMARKNARDFMEKEIIPVADEYERRREPMSRQEVIHFMKKLAPLGYLGGLVPVELGGGGLDYVTHAILLEELARAWGSLCWVQTGIDVSGPTTLWQCGNEKMRDKYLGPTLALEKIISFAITEPDHGSDPSKIETRAVLDGDHYVINGTKTWISSSSISDVLGVVAVTDPSKGPQGFSMIMADRDVSQWTDRELPKMGYRAAPTCEVSLVDCRVPKENVLFGEGPAFKGALAQSDFGRSCQAAQSTGIMQAAVDAAIEYSKNRHQFGRPIAGFQLIQAILADCTVETEAVRLLTYKVRDMMTKGQRCIKEVAMLKFFSTETAVRVTNRAMEVFGSYGISEEYPMERYYRDARVMITPDGTAQIQRLITGRELTGISAIR